MSDAPGGTDGREYTRLDAFLALCLTRFREFYRESEVVFWSFAFPIMLSVGLGIAFRNRPAETLRVALVVAPRTDESVEYRLDPSRSESAIARARADDALQRAAGRRDPVASAV